MSRTGRPTPYKPEYATQVIELCERSATDEEIADFFKVDVRTIYRWKVLHEEFCQSLKIGKHHADNRVERSLYEKATGFWYTEQQAIKVRTGPHQEEIKIVEVERFQPADTTAGIFWLKNRNSKDWRDKRELEHSGQVSLSNLPDEELERIAAMGKKDG